MRAARLEAFYRPLGDSRVPGGGRTRLRCPRQNKRSQVAKTWEYDFQRCNLWCPPPPLHARMVAACVCHISLTLKLRCAAASLYRPLVPATQSGSVIRPSPSFTATYSTIILHSASRHNSLAAAATHVNQRSNSRSDPFHSSSAHANSGLRNSGARARCTRRLRLRRARGSF